MATKMIALVIFLGFIFLNLFSQEEYDWYKEIRKEKQFSSLDEALKNPLQVKRLKILSEDLERLVSEVDKFSNILELSFIDNEIRSFVRK